jgi:hypothetical protein
MLGRVPVLQELRVPLIEAGVHIGNQSLAETRLDAAPKPSGSDEPSHDFGDTVIRRCSTAATEF